ncbi:hypothetical protein PAPHI01_1242 [Pancytospora philotis]|nr:hypothetical protein PAPHI01_1234 [Pancytospora philotis]KAI4291968.1 hypothetical protein PAPHI01_1242 [Pancytospora philotis]
MVKLYLVANKQAYFPRDVVACRLMLQTKSPIRVQSLEIALEKRQSLAISSCSGQEATGSTLGSPSIIYRHTFSLLTDSQLGTGEHVFPLRYTVRDDEGATGSLHGKFSDVLCAFANECTLSARCIYGRGEEAVCTKRIQICNRIDTGTSLSAQIELKSWLCLRRSVYFFQLATDRAFYSAGDQLLISFFPSSICRRRVVRSVEVSLYENFAFGSGPERLTRSRLLAKARGTRTKENVFAAEMRLPQNICGVVSDHEFSVRIVLACTVVAIDGSTLKLKKYIDAGRPQVSIPEIIETFNLGEQRYSEALLDY